MNTAGFLRINTVRAFRDWLRMRGSSPAIVYHEGDLTRDRRQPLLMSVAGSGPIFAEDKDIFELDALARAVLKAADHGAVRLVQHRKSAGEYVYLAFKPRRR